MLYRALFWLVLKRLPAETAHHVGFALLRALMLFPGAKAIARWLCAAIPPLPAIDERITRPRSIDEALRMTARALRAWLEEVGADQIAFAIGKTATAISTGWLEGRAVDR